MLGIYLACGLKQQNEHVFSVCLVKPLWESMLILLPMTTRTHRISLMTIVLIIDRKYREQVTGLKVGYKACDGHTNCLSLTSDHHSRARDADMILFQLEFVISMWVTFCRTDHSIKMSRHCDWPIDGRKHVMKHVLITPIVLSITSDYHCTWRWYGICFSQICYDIDSDILQHW